MPDLGSLVDAIQDIQARRAPLLERLRAIEERRATTAPAVYERVRRETEEKLAQVDAEASRLGAQATEARAEFERRRTDLENAVRLATEALEEVQFRNSLGEYAPGEYESVAAEKTRALEQVRTELGEAQAVLDLLGPPAPARADKPAAVPPSPRPVAPVDGPPTEAIQRPVARVAPPSSEMEALFGSGSLPKASLPPPPRPAASPAPTGAPREETTQDLGVSRGEAPARAPFPAGASFHPMLIVKTKDKDRGEDAYDLAPGQTLIGRAPENDIILLEESVSRRHARMTVENDECSFEDMGSANGSYVNGERLKPRQPRKLQDSDVIKMGQLLALFRTSPED